MGLNKLKNLKSHIPKWAHSRLNWTQGALWIAAAGLTAWAIDVLLCLTAVPARMFTASLSLLAVTCIYQYYLNRALALQAGQVEREVEIRTEEMAKLNLKLQRENETKDEMERSLRDSEERFYCIAEATTEGIIMHKDGVVLDGNRVAAAMFGTRLESMVGQDLVDLFDKEQSQEFFDGIANGRAGQYEANGLRQDKSSFSAEVACRSYPFFGQRVDVIAVRDLTRRIEIEKEKEEASKQASIAQGARQALLECSPDAIVMFSSTGLIYECNASAVEATAYSATELKTMGMSSLFVEEHAGTFQELFEKEGNQNKATRAKLKSRRADGVLRDVEVTVARVPGDDKIQYLAQMRDITESIQFEEQLRRSHDAALESARFKSRFLANMSHEIRTPMNAIMGLNDLLRDSDLQPRQREYVDTVHRSAENLLELINEVLDLSRIEAGRLKLQSEPFHLGRALDQVISMFNARAMSKNLDLQMKIEAGLSEWVEGDRQRLGQVLVNIVGNAVKFTPSGEIVLEVSRDKGQGRKLDFVIQDSGPGVKNEDKERLFQPFVQADSSSTRHHEGTGLGLAITKELVEMLGGTVHIEDRLDGQNGCRFVFSVAMDEVEEPENYQVLQDQDYPRAQGQAERNRLERNEKLKNMTVLVVEDNPVNQTVAVHQLERLGYKAEVAADGSIALDLLEKQQFNLVLMDCQMPVMDGFEAASRLRQSEIDRSLKRVPVIAMTANALAGDRQKCLDAGMDDYITKPVDLERLSLVLEKWVDGYETPSQVKVATLPKQSEVVNLTALRRGVGEGTDGDDLAAKIFEIFKAETPGRIQGMADAVSQNDEKGLAQKSHALQGGCAAVGALNMAAMCKEIYKQAVANSFDGAGEAVQQVWKEYERVLDFFNKEESRDNAA